MIDTLRTLMEKTYAISERKLVLINIALAGFVALAHGGALATTFSKPTPEAEEIRQLASISLPIAAVVLLSAIAALVNTRLRPKVLAFHAIALTTGAGFLLLWALSVLFNGLPEGRFSWSLGSLSAAVFYAALLFCRFSVSPQLRSSQGVYYGPILALACAVPVDVGVFLRVVG